MLYVCVIAQVAFFKTCAILILSLKKGDYKNTCCTFLVKKARVWLNMP